MKAIFKSALLAASFSLLFSTSAQALCTGRPFIITEMDISQASPVTIGMFPSLPTGAGPAWHSAIQMAVPPVTLCPKLRPCGVVKIGGIPRHLIETTEDAGCSTSIGIKLLPPMFSLNDGSKGSSTGSSNSRKVQTHIFSLDAGALDILTGLACGQVSSVGLISMSELNFCDNIDACSVIKAPYYLPFSVPPISMSGIPDGLIAEVDSYGSDLIYGCYGGKGCNANLSTNITQNGSPYQSQLVAAARAIARNYATFSEFQTTGPSATCFSHQNPIMVKSENRFQNCGVGPERCSYGRPDSVSGSGFFQFPPPEMSRGPGAEGGYFIHYKGMNCCVNPFALENLKAAFDAAVGATSQTIDAGIGAGGTMFAVEKKDKK